MFVVQQDLLISENSPVLWIKKVNPPPNIEELRATSKPSSCTQWIWVKQDRGTQLYDLLTAENTLKSVKNKRTFTAISASEFYFAIGLG